MSEPVLPTGVVTFLLTDVQDSTGHWARPDAAAAMGRQREVIARAIATHGGVQPIEQGEGDSTVSAFTSPTDALAAAVAIQRDLRAEEWPSEPISVRLGVHTGQAVLVDDRTYGGQSIVRCARLRDLAHGGQVLVSSATVVLAQDELPDGVVLRELATVRLKGLDRAEQSYQLEHPELTRVFPALITDAPDTRLPNYPTSFVGRESEILQVCNLVGDARLVTVTGAGGSGKTRLAHQVALAVADTFDDGVVWVDLCRVDDGARLASEVATVCGLAESPGGVDAATMVALHLSSNHRLVVLDNCEHVLDGAAGLIDLVLGRAGKSAILATSREPLGVAGETVWRIPSLEVPTDVVSLDSVRDASAVALFFDRARAGQPGFVLNADNVDAVVAICRRVDGIPLAIELAAARLRTMSLDDLVTGLDDRFRLLAAGPRSLERQRTLLASIDWSHDLLDADEQILFRRLGVFASPFTLAAAEAIGTDAQLDRLAVFDLLARLVDKSLVHHDERGYSMLETIRQYSAQKTVDAGEIAELRTRHLNWFVQRIADWGFDNDLVELDAFEAADLVLPDLRAALDWAATEDPSAAPRLLSVLTDLIGSRDRFREMSDLVQDVCAHETEGSAAWAELLAAATHQLPLALTDWWIEPATRAVEDETRPPAVRRRLEWGLLQIGLIMGVRGGADRVERLLAEARADGDDRFEGRAAVTLALTSAVNGDLTRAEPLLAWCERRYPHHSVTHFFRSIRTIVYVNRGEMLTALDVVLARAPSEPRMPTMFAADLLAAALTRSEEVLRALEVEIDRREFHGALAFVPPTVRFWIAAVTGDLDEMEAHCERALEAAIGVGQQPSVLCYRAKIGLARGDFERAQADIKAAAALIADFDQPLIEPWIGLITAEVARAMGETTSALDGAHGALDLAERQHLRWNSIQLLEFFALSAGDDGDLERAGRLLGACDAFRSRNGFTFRWEHSERDIECLRPRLDSATVEQGLAMSIDDAVAYARGTRGERSRPSFGWDALTPAEVRVVDFVAEGLSNKQIGEKLFVTVATVKTHLVHVYQKLELSSRAELIAAALSQERAR